MESLFYLFGVTDRSINTDYEIAHDDTIALYEKVALEDFGPGKLDVNLQNMEWVNQKVVHHQHVLEKSIENRTVIPFKFGSLFSSKEQVSNMLSERKDQFKQLLTQLKDKQEWGFKLFYNESALEEQLNTTPELSELQNKMLSSSPGKQFLLKKKYTDLLKEEKKQAINLVRQEVFEKLNSLSPSKLLKNDLPSQSAHHQTTILNIAFLTDEQSFREKVTSLSMLNQSAFLFETSGPWPAYNFVEL